MPAQTASSVHHLRSITPPLAWFVTGSGVARGTLCGGIGPVSLHLPPASPGDATAAGTGRHPGTATGPSRDDRRSEADARRGHANV